MTSEQFAYWLQGFAELHDGPPTPDQWIAIIDHLALVFSKVTPSYGGVMIQTVPGSGQLSAPLKGARLTC